MHLPFAANVLVTVAPLLRERTNCTAHIKDFRVNLLEDDADIDVPGILEVFSSDRVLAERVARTTVLNADIRDVFVEGGVSPPPPDRVDVIPNGAYLDRFGAISETDLERVRSAYGVNDQPFLLFVGTVMPRKGVTELVRALRSVAEDGTVPTPRTVLVGEKTLDSEYTQRVEQLIVDRN